MQKTIPLSDQFSEYFLENNWLVVSMAQNAEGRTPFVAYRIFGGHVHVCTGASLDFGKDNREMYRVKKTLAALVRKTRFKVAMTETQTRNAFLLN